MCTGYILVDLRGVIYVANSQDGQQMMKLKE